MPEKKNRYGQFKTAYDDYKQSYGGAVPNESDDEWRRKVSTDDTYASEAIEDMYDQGVNLDWLNDAETEDDERKLFRQGLGLRMYDAPKPEDYKDDTFLWDENGNEGKTAQQKYETDKAQYDADYQEYVAQLPKFGDDESMYGAENLTDEERNNYRERAAAFTEKNAAEKTLAAVGGALGNAVDNINPFNWMRSKEEILAENLASTAEKATRRESYFQNVKDSIRKAYADNGINLGADHKDLDAITVKTIDAIKEDTEKAFESAMEKRSLFDEMFENWTPENRLFNTDSDVYMKRLRNAGEYFYDRTKDTYEQAWLDEGTGGFWQGLWNGVTNTNELLFGIPESKATQTMTDLFKKAFVSNEELTPEEQMTLDSYFEYAQAQALRAGTASIGSEAGASAGMSLQFMATMAVSGGISGALTKGASKLVAKTVAKGMAKTLGCNAEFVEKVVSRYLAKGTNWDEIRRKAAPVSGKLSYGAGKLIDAGELAEKTARLVWGGAVQTAVSPSTLVHAYDATKEHITIGENGMPTIEQADQENMLKAWWGQVAFGDDFWEIASERGGGEIISKAMKLVFGNSTQARKLASLTGYANDMRNMAGGAVRSSLKNLRNFVRVPKVLTDKMGMHDVPDEMLEEVFGQFGQFLSSEHTEEDWKTLCDFFTPESFETLVLSFSTIPIIGSGASALKYANAKSMYNGSYTQASQQLDRILGAGQGKSILDNVLGQDIDNIGETISNAVHNLDNLSYQERATIGTALMQVALAKSYKDGFNMDEGDLELKQRYAQRNYREQFQEPQLQLENDRREAIGKGLQDMLTHIGGSGDEASMDLLADYAQSKGLDLEEFVNTEIDAETMRDIEHFNIDKSMRQQLEQIPVIEGTRIAVQVSKDGEQGQILKLQDNKNAYVLWADGTTTLEPMSNLTQELRIDDLDAYTQQTIESQHKQYEDDEMYRKGDIFNVTKSYKAKEKANGEVEMQEVEGGTKRLADYSNGVYTFEDGSSITEEQLAEDESMMSPLWTIGADALIGSDGNSYNVLSRQIHLTDGSFGSAFHGDGYVVAVTDKNGNTTEQVMSADELFRVVATSAVEQGRLGEKKLSESLKQVVTPEEMNKAFNDKQISDAQSQNGSQASERASMPQDNEVIIADIDGEPKMLDYVSAEGDTYVYRDSDGNEVSLDAVKDRDKIVGGREAYKAQVDYENSPEGRIENEARKAIANTSALTLSETEGDVAPENIPAILAVNTRIEKAVNRIAKLQTELSKPFDYSDSNAVKTREKKKREYDALNEQLPFLEQVKDKIWEMNGWSAQEVRAQAEANAKQAEENKKAEEIKKEEEAKQAEAKKAQEVADAEKAKNDPETIATNLVATSKGDIAKSKKLAEQTKAKRESELATLEDKLSKAEDKIDLDAENPYKEVEKIQSDIEAKKKEVAKWDNVLKAIDSKMPKEETKVEETKEETPKAEPKEEKNEQVRKKTTDNKEKEEEDDKPEPPTPTGGGKPKKESKASAKTPAKVESRKVDTPMKPTDGVRKLGASLMSTPKAWEVSEWDFTTDNDQKPILGGIYHDNGKIVATDGISLTAVKGEYDKSLEGKTTDKTDTPIDGHFPNYKSVIPDVEDQSRGYEKSAVTSKQLAVMSKAVEAMKCIRLSEDKLYIKVENSYINAVALLRCAKMAEKHGLELYVHPDASRPVVFHGENGDVVLMPYSPKDTMSYVDVETGKIHLGESIYGIDFGSNATSAKKAMIATTAFLNSLDERSISQLIAYGKRYEQERQEAIENLAKVGEGNDFVAKEAKRLSDKMKNLPKNAIPSNLLGDSYRFDITALNKNIEKAKKSGKVQEMQEMNDILFGAVALDTEVKMPTSKPKDNVKDNSSERFSIGQPTEGVLFPENTDESIAHAVKLGESLNTEAVVINSVDEIPSTEETAINAVKNGTEVNAWYGHDGKVYIYKPTFDKYGTSKEQMVALIFHEVIAHKGIPAMMSERQAKSFYKMVWSSMTQQEQADMLSYVEETRNLDGYAEAISTPLGKRTAEQKALIEDVQRHAADEFVAHLAEQVSNEENAKGSVQKRWDAIVKYLQNLLSKLYGERVFMPETQIRRAILASKKNLEKGNGEFNADDVRTRFSIENLHKAEKFIKDNLHSKKVSGRFKIELPTATLNLINKKVKKPFTSHNIEIGGIRHALKNHGVNGKKIENKSIPIREEDTLLIPYIMTAPDRIETGSTTLGRTSIRFYKSLSNGEVVVVEKEWIDSQTDMETINMWAELSNVADAQRPLSNVQNVLISTSDAAKIRKDAYNAIEKELKSSKLDSVQTDDKTRVSVRNAHGFKDVISLGGEEYNVAELEESLKSNVEKVLSENDFDDVKINAVKLIGSRLRGEEREDSDLDLLVEYSGRAKEDTLFNVLNEEPIYINGVQVDINPITEGKSGTIEQFLDRNKGFSKERFSVRQTKQSQFDIIKNANPMRDNIHVGIRSVEDIKTFDEAYEEGEQGEIDNKKNLENAKNTGNVTIYSSKPIRQGGFVSTSKMMAGDYAGGKGNKIYTREVSVDKVAWINLDEGQFADTNNPTEEELVKSDKFVIDDGVRFSVRRPRRSQEEINADNEAKRNKHTQDLLDMNKKLADFIAKVASLADKTDLNLLSNTSVDEIRNMLKSGLTPLDIKRQGSLIEKKAKAFRSLANQLIKAVETRKGYDITKQDLKAVVSLATKAVAKPSLDNMQECANKLFDTIQDIIYGSANMTLGKLADKDYMLKNGKVSGAISVPASIVNKTIIDNLPKSLDKNSSATIDSIEAQIDIVGQEVAAISEMLERGELAYDKYSVEGNGDIVKRQEYFFGDNVLSGEDKAKARLEELNAQLDGLNIARELHFAEAYRDEAVNEVKGKDKSDVNAYGARRAMMQNAILLQDEAKKKWQSLIETGKLNKADRGVGINKVQHSIQSAVSAILHDMDGVKSAKQGRPYSKNGFLHALFGGPLRSLDYMLDKISPNTLSGTGQLRGIVHRLLDNARNQELRRREAIRDKLLDNAAEIFGDEKMTMIDLINREAKDAKYADGKKVTFWNDDMEQDYPLTIGQLAAIYAWSKQEDSAAKLEKSHIYTDEVPETDVHGVLLDDMLQGLPSEWKAWMDYLQSDFLPEHRNEYNVVYKQRYGHDMPEIENYFPFAIDRNAYEHKEELNDQNAQESWTMSVSSEISRTRNNNPFDIVNNTAMSILSHHISQTERVYNYNEATEVLRALCTNKVVVNKIRGISDETFQDFKDACRVALGFGVGANRTASYADYWAGKIIRNIAATKIRFRPWTALKQLQSFITYGEEFANADFATEYVNIFDRHRALYGLKWAYNNLPQLKERWDHKYAGDVMLDETMAGTQKTIGKQSHADPLARWLAERKSGLMSKADYGMLLNAYFDRVTCALGASAMYRAKLKQFKKAGVLTQEQIDNNQIPAHLHDAAVRAAQHIYNKSQQSTERMYLSPMQTGGTLTRIGANMFMNASIAYQRILMQSAYDLRKFFGNPGVLEESARQSAEAEMRELGVTDPAAIEKAVSDRKTYLAVRLLTKPAAIGTAITTWSFLSYYASQGTMTLANWMFSNGGDDDDEEAREIALKQQGKREEDAKKKAWIDAGCSFVCNNLAYGSIIKSVVADVLESAFTDRKFDVDETIGDMVQSVAGIGMLDDSLNEKIRRISKSLDNKAAWGVIFSIADAIAETTGKCDLDVINDMVTSVLTLTEKHGDLTPEDWMLAFEQFMQMPKSARDELVYNRRSGEYYDDVIERVLLQDYYNQRMGTRGSLADINKTSADKLIKYNVFGEMDDLTDESDGSGIHIVDDTDHMIDDPGYSRLLREHNNLRDMKREELGARPVKKIDGDKEVYTEWLTWDWGFAPNHHNYDYVWPE